MKKIILSILSITASILLISYCLGSCVKDNNSYLTSLDQVIPQGFPAPLYTFRDNPLTKEGFELGKKLFYDGRLSVDNAHSCASCHQQIAAFGTFEHDRSHGVNQTHTLRNAPPLFNLAWQTKFHWDGQFNSLYEEAAQPIHGSNQMGETFNNVVNKLQADAEYRKMFKKIFRTEFISPDHILKALAQFTGYLTSSDSKYDRYKKGQYTYTSDEENGYQVFKAKCATCHPEPMFTDYSFRNIGLPVDPALNDYGKFLVTRNPKDSLKFRVPSLRNVDITSHYMHDGRFATMQDCINHYRTGVQQSTSLDPSLSSGITMTDGEANNLVRFLRTLTDSSIITNPMFRN